MHAPKRWDREDAMARNLRRVAVLRAFRQFARLGLDRGHRSASLVYRRILGVARDEREMGDLLSVYETLRLLRAERSESLSAVEGIFFDLSISPRRRNDMTYAVRRYAMEHHYDERTVYRQLARAERLYLALREERAEDND